MGKSKKSETADFRQKAEELVKTNASKSDLQTSEEEKSEFAESLINTVREPLLALDQDLRVVKASRSFHKFFKVTPGETIGKLIYDLGNRQWDIPKLRELLEKILPEKTTFDDYEVEHDFSTIGKRVMLLNARQIKRAFGKEKIILLAIEDITDRKLAEEKTTEKNRLTNEYTDVLLNYAHAPIIIWDSSLVIKRFNHQFEKMSGYHSSEVIDKKIDILFPKDKIESTLELLKNHLNDENSEVFELDILTKNKGVKTVLWNSANILDKEGTSAIATIAHDITEQKRTEKSLKESEERFRVLYENAKVGLYRTTPDGTILMANKVLLKMLGYSSFEKLAHRNLEKSGFEQNYVRKAFKEEIERDGELNDFETSWVHLDGSVFFVRESAQAIRDSEGITLYYDGMVEDITERKRTENEIVMLGHSLKSINECISITDLDDNILFVNESFLHTYGYETSELIGKHISIVRATTNKKDKVDEILPATILGEWQGELFQKRKDGSEFPVSLSTTAVKDKEDKIIGLIGVATDITDRRREENELIEAKEKAEEGDRLKSAFLANMSHEVRTPLNSIIGFSELLGDADFPEDQKSEFIRHIISNGNNLLNIISDIVDISKIESGEITIRKSKIQVKKLLAEISAIHVMNVEEKNLRVTTSLAVSDSEAEIFVLADKERLLQIFNNLISNALKFTSEGYIELGCRPVGDRIEFHVKDTGIGIPSDYHAKIFERFRQVEASYTRKFGGNGLGLAISKNLVELMGGKIWVESEVGKGSTFYFSLPCVR